jgi:spore coat assembly protein
VFRVTDIVDKLYILKGLNVRLFADSYEDDLELYSGEIKINDETLIERIDEKLERDDFFYLPGKILHIDGDKEYLERCLNLYKKFNVLAYGIVMNEDEIKDKIKEHLESIKPDILVITGHDAYYKKKGNYSDLNAYKNSSNFIDAVIEARKFERAHDKLIIIAGACGSYYEGLIKNGANFASSPKRINIHALDPAIIALKISLTDINKNINIMDIIEKTKYGKDGMGGIITHGTMYVGYPRV